MDHGDSGGSSGYSSEVSSSGYQATVSDQMDHDSSGSSGDEQYDLDKMDHDGGESSGCQRYSSENKHDKVTNLLTKMNLNEPTMIVQQASQLTTQQRQDIEILSEAAVDELNRLCFNEKNIWVTIDGRNVINQEKYESTFSHPHISTSNPRIESSIEGMEVPMEAKKLVKILLESEKWGRLFPTIVNNVELIHTLGSDIPIDENCTFLQVIRQQLHILSPLVPARDFEIVRCCQKIKKGEWIIADVSYKIVSIDQSEQALATCYKRPSGCLIEAMPDGRSKVTWIEHVEVDDESSTHEMYRRLLCGDSGSGCGYGAKRWILALKRMCERPAQTEVIPTYDTIELKIGVDMLMEFNEMLTRSREVDIRHLPNDGVITSVWTNTSESDKHPGLVFSASTSVLIPRTPSQVFKCLRVCKTRHQWDFLCSGNVFSKVNRVSTGASITNCVTTLKPKQADAADVSMLMIEERYADALGGMFVYSLADFPFLPCGFTISPQYIATDENGVEVHEGGTLLTMVLQKFVPSESTMTDEMKKNEEQEMISLINSTVQRIKAMLDCP